MSDLFAPVKMLEQALEEYTGAPFAVVVNSCTNALGIVFEYIMNNELDITAHMPRLTYIGVPMQAKRAGMRVNFTDAPWTGEYKINLTYRDNDDKLRIVDADIWDSARRFRSGMWYENGPAKYDVIEGPQYKCVSFHGSKILGHTQGGAILTNDAILKSYAIEMRHDGRVYSDPNNPKVLGRHDYMWPDTAAALYYKIKTMPKYNNDLPNSDYPDLSAMEIFK